ncbi:hypothetical protein PG993_006771 [Apiospora rasikravindrae]|uniref:Uncharacterized protein n=1 Tax=Apiospora rasikravindrae TaxID=990691 RepID=A0ABR1T6M5_9PEZI
MANKSDAALDSRLAQSAYLSPYSRAGASPADHAGDSDPYKPLRARALATLEAMGYDPATMVERGVVWAEDQDPFGHVMQSQYMHFLGTCFHRVMESYDEHLTKQEYDDMIHARTVMPVVRKYELDIRRQVKYPDSVSPPSFRLCVMCAPTGCSVHSPDPALLTIDNRQLIAAFRQDLIEPTRNNGTTSLYSLRQQTIVAEAKGSTTYMDVRTGRPVDIRTLGGNWPVLFAAFTVKSANANARREKWEKEHPKAKAKPPVASKI